MKTKNKKNGFGLLEAIISVAIAAVLLLSLTLLTTQSAKAARSNAKTLKALIYSQELLEIAKDLERSGWDNEILKPECASPSACHPEISGGSWVLLPGAEEVEDFYTRFVTIEPVCRDAAKKIAACDGTNDSPETKKVTAILQWEEEGAPKELKLETYVYKF